MLLLIALLTLSIVSLAISGYKYYRVKKSLRVLAETLESAMQVNRGWLKTFAEKHKPYRPTAMEVVYGPLGNIPLPPIPSGIYTPSFVLDGVQTETNKILNGPCTAGQIAHYKERFGLNKKKKVKKVKHPLPETNPIWYKKSF